MNYVEKFWTMPNIKNLRFKYIFHCKHYVRVKKFQRHILEHKPKSDVGRGSFFIWDRIKMMEIFYINLKIGSIVTLKYSYCKREVVS